MKYVKSFDILGIDTAQIPCIELYGVPNTATVGAVGLLGMDVTSEGREIYVCTKVDGAIYTWQSLRDGKDGTSLTKSEINAAGELILTLSDGQIINAGVVRGADGKDGANGEQGEPGVSVTNAQVIDGELVITLSDGTEKNVGKVIGGDGADGVSIVKAELNDRYELIVTLSNETIMNLGSIKGDKGEPGVQVLTQAEYDALETKEQGVVYILSDDAEHLYLHTATLIVTAGPALEYTIIFSVSFTDTLAEKKDNLWYANKIVYGNQRTILAPVTRIKGSTKESYYGVSFTRGGDVVGVNLYDESGSVTSGTTIGSVTVITADPMPLR